MNDYGGLGNQGLAAMLLQASGRLLTSAGGGERTGVGLGQALMGGVQDYYTLMDRAERKKKQDKDDAAKELQMKRAQQEIEAADKEAALRAKMIGMADPNVQQTYADSLNTQSGFPFAPGMAQPPAMPQSMPTPQMPPIAPMQGAGLGQSMINPNWQPPAPITPQQAGRQGLAQATNEFMMQTASPEVLARMNAPVKQELPDVEIVDIGGQKIAVNKTALQQWAAANPGKPLTDFILNKTESPNAPSTVINMPSPLQQSHEDKAFGDMLVKKIYEPAMDGAKRAKYQNNKLTTQLKLMEGGLTTGKLAPFTSAASAWLVDMGIASDEAKAIAADSQKFNAISSELVLDAQKEQTGPQTESDAKRLEMTQAALGNTPEANKFIISFAVAQNNERQKYYEFLRDYRGINKSLDGVEKAWEKAAGNRSLFDDPILKPWRSYANQETSQLRPSSGWSIKRIE